MTTEDWAVIYLGWLVAAIIGGIVGHRCTYWYWLKQRRRLVSRWKMERRKHRQRRPWVKAWVYRLYLSGNQWKREYGQMINRKTKPMVLKVLNRIDP